MCHQVSGSEADILKTSYKSALGRALARSLLYLKNELGATFKVSRSGFLRRFLVRPTSPHLALQDGTALSELMSFNYSYFSFP